MKKQSCRTCKWLKKPERFSKWQTYQCTFPAALPVLPDSVTTYYSFPRDLPKRFMHADDGTQCPTYEARP